MARSIAEGLVGTVLARVNGWSAENTLSLDTVRTEYVIYRDNIRRDRTPPIKLKLGDAITNQPLLYPNNVYKDIIIAS